MGGPVVVIGGGPGGARFAERALAIEDVPAVESALTFGAAVELAARKLPAVAVLRMSLSELAGSDAFRRLQARAPRARVVICRPVEHPAGTQTGANVLTVDDAIFASGGTARDDPIWPVDVAASTSGLMLPPHPTSGSRARQFVAAACTDAGAEALLDAACLVTSELVTNAVCHARTAVDLTVRVAAELIRIDVRDEMRDPLQVPRAGVEASGGRGLTLIDALSSLWGVDPSTAGKTVWAQVASD